MTRLAPPFPFAGPQLGQIRHVCVFSKSADEEYSLLVPLIRGGLVCAHKAVHVVKPQPGNHAQRPAEATVVSGVPARVATAAGDTDGGSLGMGLA
jgi:hypothetical protein